MREHEFTVSTNNRTGQTLITIADAVRLINLVQKDNSFTLENLKQALIKNL